MRMTTRRQLALIMLLGLLPLLPGSRASAGDSAGHGPVELTPSAAGQYSLAPEAATQYTLTQTANTLELALAKPMTIAEEVDTLALWYTPAKYLEATAIVRDAAGRDYEFPFAMSRPMYNTLNDGWGHYSTGDIHVNPNAYTTQKMTPPVVLTRLVLKHSFPAPRKFSLGWLTLQTNADFRQPRWELASLEDFQRSKTWRRIEDSGRFFTDGGYDSRPRLPLQKVLPAPGTYTLAIRLRSGWQGKVLRDCAKTVTVTPAQWDDPIQGTLELPTPAVSGTDDSFFVEIRTRGSSGELAALRHFWLNLYRWDSKPDQRNTTDAEASLDLRGGEAGVLAKDDPDECRITLGKGLSRHENLQLEVQLARFDFSPISTMIYAIPPARTAQCWSVAVHLPLSQEAGGAERLCRVIVRLSDGTTTLDRDGMLIGRPEDAPQTESAAPAAPTPAFVPPQNRRRLGGCILVSAMIPEPMTKEDYRAHLGHYLDWARSCGQDSCEIAVPLADLMPLPGVFRFTMIDELLAMAQQRGLQMTLSIWNFADYYPRWLFANPMRYETGSTYLYNRCRMSLDFAHPAVRREMTRLWDAVAKRYAGNPTLKEYLLCGPNLDCGYIDMLPALLAGYSPAFVQAWQEELQRKYPTPEAAARAHGTTYAAWEAALPPRAQRSAAFDIRPVWRDFMDFRARMLEDYYRMLYQTIRRHDRTSFLYQYALYNSGPVEQYFPLFRQYGVGVTIGSSEFEHLQRFPSVAGLWGIPYRGEPQAAQAMTAPDFTMSLWCQLPYANSANDYAVQWHNEFPANWKTDLAAMQDLQRWNQVSSNPLTRLLEFGTPQIIRDWSPVFRELQGAVPLPTEVGCLFSYHTQMYVYRNFSVGHTGGNALSELLNRKLHLVPRWISERTPYEQYAGLKVVLLDPEMPLLSTATADLLLRFVHDGGTLITCPEAGAVTLESGQPDYRLLQAAGADLVAASPAEAGAYPAALEAASAKQTLALTSFHHLRLPPAARAFGQTPSGKPLGGILPVGKGRLCLFAGKPDYPRSAPFLEELLRSWGVVKSCAISPQSGVNDRLRVFRMKQGEVEYLGAGYVFNGYETNRATGTPLATTPEIVRLQAFGLPYGRYQVRAITPPHRELGVVAEHAFATGIPLYLQPGELCILRCDPVK